MRKSLIPWYSSWLMAVVMTTAGVQRSEGSLPTAELRHRVVLDQHGDFVMLWTPENDNIRVEIQVATRGWVGLGFSPNGGMHGADITLGWVDALGEVHVHDRYAHGMMIPIVDNSQDVVVEGGYQNDTHTVLRFSRPWNTCDNEHDFKLSDDTTRVIWAYGEEDPVDEMMMERHMQRGTKSMYLKEPRFTPPVMTEDIKTWDMLSINVSVPSHTDTLYWCKIVEVPKFPSKIHITGFQPIIVEENRPFVHHILVYACTGSYDHLAKWTEFNGVQCYTPNMPPSWAQCRTMFIVWAVGSEGEMFPEHVGIPLGEKDDPSFLLMEMHYDNQLLVKDIVDNSGIRIFYTEKLRQYDAAIMSVGHTLTENMMIPPNQIWKSVSHCSDQCTKSNFPPEGIKVFQVFHHAHLLGRKLTLRHIRNHRELPNFSYDHNYDFNYQQARVLKEEKTVLPGDSFILECLYDSTKKPVPTFGGEGTNEEMCLVFFTYYPKIPLGRCRSNPVLENILQSLGVKDVYIEKTSVVDDDRESRLLEALIEKNGNPVVEKIDYGAQYKKVNILSPASFKNKTLYDVFYDEATWKDKTKMKELQKRIEYNPHNVICGPMKHKYAYPDFLTLKTLEDEVCSEGHESQVYLSIPPGTEQRESLSLAVTAIPSLPALLAPLLLLLLFSLKGK